MFKKKPISELKDAEQGKSVYVLANGPSVVDHDLSLLREKLVIGMNASTSLEEQFCFRQSYYVVSDARFLEHPDKKKFATHSLHEETKRILRSDLVNYDHPDWINRTYYVSPLSRNGFSFDLEQGYYFGCTTTMLAVQLAAYLGCKYIYLLGVDLQYSPGAYRFYDETAPQQPDDFTSIQIWNLSNAARLLKDSGKQLICCTKNSRLRPYIPYMEFELTRGLRE